MKKLLIAIAIIGLLAGGCSFADMPRNNDGPPPVTYGEP